MEIAQQGGERHRDILFQLKERKFNYKVSAVRLSENRLLAMHCERSPYCYLTA